MSDLTAPIHLDSMDQKAVMDHETALLDYATESLIEVGNVRVIGTAARKAGVLSFVSDGIHPHDMGTILDQKAVAVRTGHHCAQPVMEAFGIPATTRASFAFYNTFAEVDRLIDGVRTAQRLFA